MVTLLLDHGAPIDMSLMLRSPAFSQNALHYACAQGYLPIVECMVARGADLTRRGRCGTALGFAVDGGRVSVNGGCLEVVRLLLDKGADASEAMPASYGHRADLLSVAMGLRRSGAYGKWQGLPLNANRKRLMALLLAHGASKEATMAIISGELHVLAKRARHTEAEYLEVVQTMLKEAEEAVPEVLSVSNPLLVSTN